MNENAQLKIDDMRKTIIYLKCKLIDGKNRATHFILFQKYLLVLVETKIE